MLLVSVELYLITVVIVTISYYDWSDSHILHVSRWKSKSADMQTFE